MSEFWRGVICGASPFVVIAVIIVATIYQFSKEKFLWYQSRKLNPRPRYDGVYEDAVKRMEGR